MFQKKKRRNILVVENGKILEIRKNPGRLTKNMYEKRKPVS